MNFENACTMPIGSGPWHGSPADLANGSATCSYDAERSDSDFEERISAPQGAAECIKGCVATL
jgi:hypothetical protein